MMLSFYSTLQKTAEHLFTFHSHFITNNTCNTCHNSICRKRFVDVFLSYIITFKECWLNFVWSKISMCLSKESLLLWKRRNRSKLDIPQNKETRSKLLRPYAHCRVDLRKLIWYLDWNCNICEPQRLRYNCWDAF